MKIICNKSEFAEMVRNCYKVSGCYGCILSGLCDGADHAVNISDVVEDQTPEETEDVCEACQITYSHERESDRDNQTGEAMESLNSIRRKTAREYGEDPDA